jgi:hypothetical protein
MYKCPHCHHLSISGWSQLSPPFDGHVTCPVCHTEVRVKRRISNYFVFLYLIGTLAASFLSGHHGLFDSFIGIALLIAVAGLQIRLTKYEEVHKDQMS